MANKTLGHHKLLFTICIVFGIVALWYFWSLQLLLTPSRFISHSKSKEHIRTVLAIQAKGYGPKSQ